MERGKKHFRNEIPFNPHQIAKETLSQHPMPFVILPRCSSIRTLSVKATFLLWIFAWPRFSINSRIDLRLGYLCKYKANDNFGNNKKTQSVTYS